MRRKTTTSLTTTGLASACLLLAVGAGGCAKDLTIQDGPQYPTITQTGVVDVQVVQESKRLITTNTSSRDFGPSRVWVNSWYSQEIPGFAIGQRLELSLGDFKDRYGDTFRGGGFFASERPDKVVLVQIETPLGGPAGERELIGLITVIAPDEVR